MSILIKGVDLHSIPDDEYMVVRIWNDGSISTASCSYGVNHGEKRAVEVPTPHGRLIDVDEADKYAYDELELANGYLTGWEAARAMQKIYQSVSTVIEAEGK